MTFIGQSNFSTSQRLLNQVHRNNDRVAKSIERLSTGKRINRPSDDPAGFVAAEGLRTDLVVLKAEARGEAGRRLQSRQQESALSNIQTVLNSVRGALVSAADGTLNSSEKKALQQEIDATLDAVDRIAENTSGVADSDGLALLRTGGLANVVDGSVAEAAQVVEDKLDSLSRQRAAIGAYEKTEEIFSRLREDQIVINSETLSQIEDTDFASESAELVNGQILSEASLIALAYSQHEQAEQLEKILESLDQST